MAVLVGRDAEIAMVEHAVERAGSATSRLLITGEPGMGKTSLLDLAVAHAAALGQRILVARPTQAEAPLPFTVLADLVHDVDLSVLLPARRAVLDVALGRATASGPAPPTSHLGFALVDLFQHLSASGPVTVAIDDVHWADAASRAVLDLAARRLPPTGICVVATARTGGLADEGAEALVDGDGARLLRLAPLADEHTEQVVRGATATPIPPSMLRRIVETSGGNPLYAIEFARAVRENPPSSGRPLTVPGSLASAVRARFAGVDARGRDALAAVAMLAQPTLDVLADLGLVDALLPGEVAGIVEIVGRRIRFTHPMLATAAYEAVTGTQRLELHRRLAGVTNGTERCLHEALGATRADAVIAADLIAAALAEMGRGAATEAAEIGLLALDATPDGDPDRWTRTVAVADLLFRAGRTDEAADHAQRAHAATGDPEVQARALLTWATIEFARSADAQVAVRLAHACLDVATDPALRAEAHAILARAEYVDFAAAADHAAAALALMRELPDPSPTLLAGALTAAAAAGFNAGRGLDRASLEHAMELEDGTTVLASDSAHGTLAALLKYTDELDEARTMFEALVERSDPASVPYALGHLPQLLVWTGEWAEAERCAMRHLALAESTHQESQVESARFNLALIAAYRGDVVAAEPVAKQLLEAGRADGAPWTERMGAGLLGFLAASVGDTTAAVVHLRRYDELGEVMGLVEPGYSRFHGDYVEALIAEGLVEEAGDVLDRLATRVERLPRRSAAAVVERSRALVALAGGQRDTALTRARAAVELLAGTPLAYEHARALLTLGTISRRCQERALARDTLTAALSRFEAMGAAAFAMRARRERDRAGGRSAAPTSPHTSLTTAETSIARLAAGGSTTREIAAALHLSSKTVEAHLTRVYRKLGVANRAQLANRVAQIPHQE